MRRKKKRMDLETTPVRDYYLLFLFYTSLTFFFSLAFVDSLRRPLDEMGDGDLDVGQYRESYGSGLVNTRISDRENEVLYILYLHAFYNHTSSK